MAWHVFVFAFLFLTTTVAAQSTKTTSSKIKPTAVQVASVEVFQVIELPLSIRDVELLKTKNGYQLRGVLSNNTETQMIGLKYSLVQLDVNEKRVVSNRIEGFKLAAYSSSEVTLESPFQLQWREGARFILMLEQAFTTHDIWEVLKASEALDAYISADFSVVPRVIHAPNHTDSPLPGLRLIH